MTSQFTPVERLIKNSEGTPPRLLFVIAGPSGVGKNTIIKTLLANHPLEMDRVRTYTTRTPREGEHEGQQYHFISRDTFKTMGDRGHLLEPHGEEVYGDGHVYSMPVDIFSEIRPGAHLVIAEVDVAGTRLLKSHFPESISIFISAPANELLGRIEARDGAEAGEADLEKRRKRLDTALAQIRAAHEFDYMIYNTQGHQSDAVAVVEAIITAERHRVRDNVAFDHAFPAESFKRLDL